MWRRLGCPYEEARALAEGDLAAQEYALVTFDRLGLLALVEMLLFIAILFVGYAYVWKKGALEWD